MRKLKIAFVVGKMNGGGVETICMSYLKNLDKTRMEITFIVDSDSTALPKDEIKRNCGFVNPRIQARAKPEGTANHYEYCAYCADDKSNDKERLREINP